MNKLKKDLTIGFIIGFLSSFVLSFILYLVQNYRIGGEGFFEIFYSPALIVPILSVALLGNFVMFFIFIKLNKDLISRGILAATMVVGIILFILKFFFV